MFHKRNGFQVSTGLFSVQESIWEDDPQIGLPFDMLTCRNRGKEVVEWAASGGKNDPSAGSWYYNMPSIAGVKYAEASVADFQRLYYCAPPGKDKFCGVPPCTGCSREPCNDCFAGHQMYASLRPGCDGNNRGLGCVPPKSAMGDLALVVQRFNFMGNPYLPVSKRSG